MHRGLERYGDRANDVPDNRAELLDDAAAAVNEAGEGLDGSASSAKSREASLELREAEEEYADCAADQMAKASDAGVEHLEEQDAGDDFEDCGKDGEGQYAAEVTYSSDFRELSRQEAVEALGEIYRDCENPADMDELKEKANTDTPLQVTDARLIEEPAEPPPSAEEIEAYRASSENADAARQELVEKQRQAEQSRPVNDGAPLEQSGEEPKDDFAHWIDPSHYNEAGEYTGNYRPDDLSPAQHRQQINDAAKEAYAAHLMEQHMTQEERFEAYADYVDKLEQDHVDAAGESDEGGEAAKKVLARDPEELRKSGYAAVEDRLEVTRDDLRDKGMSDGPEMEALIQQKREEFQQEFEHDAFHYGEEFPDRRSPEDIVEEHAVEAAEEPVQEVETDPGLSQEQREEVEALAAEAVEEQAETGESPYTTEEIAKSVEREARDRLLDDRDGAVPEDVADGLYEHVQEDIENAVEDAVEEQAQQDESDFAREREQLVEAESELMNEAEDIAARIDEVFWHDNLTSVELQRLADGNAKVLARLEDEYGALADQFKEMLGQFESFEYKSDAYRQALEHYNDLHERKNAMEQTTHRLREQRNALEQRKRELSEPVELESEAYSPSLRQLDHVNEPTDQADQGEGLPHTPPEQWEQKEAEEAVHDKTIREGLASLFADILNEAPETAEEPDSIFPPGPVLEFADQPDAGEGTGLSLSQRFDKIKEVPVNELSESQKAELCEIAKENLRGQYREMISDQRLDKFFDSITFVDETFIKSVFPGKHGIMGYYSPATDTIKINLDAHQTVGDVLATLDHEGLHMVSQQTGFWGHPRGSTGFRTRSGNVGMNEGVTELLSIRNMQTIHPEYQSPAYIDEVAVMAEFEAICGADVLKTCYMQNDLETLRSDFDRSMGAGRFQSFCEEMDQLHVYSSNGMFLEASDAKVKLLAALKQYRARKEEAL